MKNGFDSNGLIVSEISQEKISPEYRSIIDASAIVRKEDVLKDPTRRLPVGN